MSKVSVPERGVETLFGTHDDNLRFLEDTFKVRIKSQGQDLLVEGDAERSSARATPSPRATCGSPRSSSCRIPRRACATT
jgi:phosphate starvation-inducible protein PhoH